MSNVPQFMANTRPKYLTTLEALQCFHSTKSNLAKSTNVNCIISPGFPTVSARTHADPPPKNWKMEAATVKMWTHLQLPCGCGSKWFTPPSNKIHAWNIWIPKLVIRIIPDSSFFGTFCCPISRASKPWIPVIPNIQPPENREANPIFQVLRWHNVSRSSEHPPRLRRSPEKKIWDEEKWHNFEHFIDWQMI